MPTIDRCAPDVDHAARDARDLEQVVDEPHQVAHLPLHRGPDPLDGLPDRRADSRSSCSRREERRERIAQLVRERRQELVLALVRAAERLRGALALREVAASLVLALAGAQRRAHRAHAASRCAPGARAASRCRACDTALAGVSESAPRRVSSSTGQIGPRRLLAQHGGERARCRPPTCAPRRSRSRRRRARSSSTQRVEARAELRLDARASATRPATSAPSRSVERQQQHAAVATRRRALACRHGCSVPIGVAEVLRRPARR